MGASARAFLERRQSESEDENYENSQEKHYVQRLGEYGKRTIAVFYFYDDAKLFIRILREKNPKFSFSIISA